jgi:6-phosphogluconolactonase
MADHDAAHRPRAQASQLQCATMIPPKIQVFPNADGLAQAAARRVVDAARESIARSGTFTFTLSGGSTPKALYELLANDEYRDRIDWPRVEIFFGDERTVPPDHPDSNYRMANQALLSKVPIKPENIHRMRGEIDPEQAAKEYGQLLKRRFGDDGGPDLVLLGIGDDGHTASLFPHTAALRETKHRAFANPVPKLNTTRLTLTAPLINRAGEILVLSAGENKAPVIRQILEEPPDPDRLPIQMIFPASGNLTYLLDVAAASMRQEP